MTPPASGSSVPLQPTAEKTLSLSSGTASGDSFSSQNQEFPGLDDHATARSKSQSKAPATPEMTTPPRNTQYNLEGEEITLLREIFPDLSREELYQLHLNHINNSVKKRLRGSSPRTPLGKRIWKQTIYLAEAEGHADENELDEEKLHWRVNLPDDFLRLPQSVAVRLFNDDTGKMEYKLIASMEEKVLKEHNLHGEAPSATANYTRRICREMHVGLGMTICEDAGCIWVHSLTGRDGTRWYNPPHASAVGGPALDQGIQPGDRVLGINGEAFINYISTPYAKESLLRHAVLSIQHSQDPVVVHLRRGPPRVYHPLAERNAITSPTPSLLDQDDENDKADQSDISDSILVAAGESMEPKIHPFAAALASKGLIKSTSDALSITKTLQQFTERTRQWEANSSFRIDSTTHELIDLFDSRDLPPSMSAATLPFEYTNAKSLRHYGPSTPTIRPSTTHGRNIFSFSENRAIECSRGMKAAGLLGHEYEGLLPESARRTSYPGSALKQHNTESPPSYDSEDSDVFIPLVGVRKALCVRIVNTFIEEDRIACTILVHDIESGREWYAPVRYYQDFNDLRAATVTLCPAIADIPFPKSPIWNLFVVKEVTESSTVREEKCRQLEHFLRQLCSIVYREKLNPGIAEVCIHVQSFLGCDTALAELDDEDLHLHIQVAVNDITFEDAVEKGHNEAQMNARLLLKRSIQRYTYRLFLLRTMEQIVNQFVDSERARGPKVDDIKALELRGRATLKDISLEELARIRAYLDQIQELIMESCTIDFISISQRREYGAIRGFMEGGKGKTYLDIVFREAVREQIEIEIYVPLRSIVSRLLVNGWRHDDMEMQFKMQELSKRTQTLFRIPPEKQSPSDWRTVSNILQQGVGRSTLPCAKLRAIVRAAKEISCLHGQEHDCHSSNIDTTASGENIGNDAEKSTIGADDFLPIFIYCVVRADMERPCALCVLLTTLCERTNRIGEIGYYLASFEAAITHIQEVDLSEDCINLSSNKLSGFP